jgi:hypothetical protein
LAQVLLLLTAYGLCFSFQQKLPLRGLWSLTDKMLGCTFCTGVVSGLLTWALGWAATGACPFGWDGLWGLGYVAGAICWAFASGGFCYTLDSAVEWLESHALGG